MQQEIIKYAKSSNVIIISHLLAGLLADSVDVFDFQPGEHTATITATNTLGSSDAESFFFVTPEPTGWYLGTVWCHGHKQHDYIVLFYIKPYSGLFSWGANFSLFSLLNSKS